MKSFHIPAQNRSLRGPVREGAFWPAAELLTGPCCRSGLGTVALPGRGVAAGLGSSPGHASRTLQVPTSLGSPLRC